MQNNRFFPEIKGNFGFGCMRLPMNGGQVDYDEFTWMADHLLVPDSTTLKQRMATQF